MPRKALVVIAALSLAACRGEEPIAEPSPSPSGIASAEPVSILREAPDPVTPALPTEPFTTTVPFAEGGTDLPAEAADMIAAIIASKQYEMGGAIVLRGHSDSVGSDAANLVSSRRRAEAVASALVEAGVDVDRITVIPLGEMRPVAPNAKLDGSPNEAGRARNRRVEVEVLLPDNEGSGPDQPAPMVTEAPEKDENS